MEMSKAAIAPRQPSVTDEQRKHPLFPAYMAYRSAMSTQLVQADRFETWLRLRERDLRDQELQQHPRFKEFHRWMRENKGGARPCPGGQWPDNFMSWLEGARW